MSDFLRQLRINITVYTQRNVTSLWILCLDSDMSGNFDKYHHHRVEISTNIIYIRNNSLRSGRGQTAIWRYTSNNNNCINDINNSTKTAM